MFFEIPARFTTLGQLRHHAKTLLLVKAVRVRGRSTLRVIDATAGTGRDSMWMAAMGHEVTLIERVPEIQKSLRTGLAALANHPVFAPLAAQLHLVEGDALALLANMTADVVYLDPMYPDAKPKASPQAALLKLRAAVGNDEDAAMLLPIARQAATHHVAVKRSQHAALLGANPQWQIIGESTRFDCYTSLHL